MTKYINCTSCKARVSLIFAGAVPLDTIIYNCSCGGLTVVGVRKNGDVVDNVCCGKKPMEVTAAKTTIQLEERKHNNSLEILEDKKSLQKKSLQVETSAIDHDENQAFLQSRYLATGGSCGIYPEDRPSPNGSYLYCSCSTPKLKVTYSYQSAGYVCEIPRCESCGKLWP